MTPTSFGARRVVWTGRHPDDLPGGRDGWNTTPAELEQLLDDALDVVVLDALSFPWRSWHPRSDAPVVVRVPDLPLEALVDLLEAPMLRRLTPHDRLLVRDPASASALAAHAGLPASVLVDLGDDERARDDWWRAPLARHFGRGLEAVETDLGRFVGLDGDLVLRHLADHGAHQRGTLNAALSLLRPGDVVVDVGAHIGTLAVPFARAVGPDGALLAVEGSPTTASLLSHNLRASGVSGWSEVRRAVMGAAGGRTKAAPRDDHNTGAQAFLPAGEGVWRGAAPTETVLTLDDVVAEALPGREPTLVKLDVEGAELDVLMGAERVLAARPVLCLEVSRQQLRRHGRDVFELDALLRERDYLLHAVSGTRHHDGPGFELSPIDSLTDWAEPLFDVVAVPADDPRAATLAVAGKVSPLPPPGPDAGWPPVGTPGVLPVGEPDPAPRAGKETLRLEVALVADELAALPEQFGTATRVHGLGDPLRTRLLRHSLPDADVQVGEDVSPGAAAAPDLVVPTPHVVVVWLRDGDQPVPERVALLREAHGRLHPGGRMVVLGYAVDGPHGTNPSTSALFGQLRTATAGMVHLEELRSFRVPDDLLTRGVLLSLSRLGPGERL